jgi:hypothetical protein
LQGLQQIFDQVSQADKKIIHQPDFEMIHILQRTPTKIKIA